MNCIVELLRFLFCVVILVHHIGIVTLADSPLPMGAIGVELFYMLSGYFMFKHIKKDTKNGVQIDMKYSMNYTLQKFIRLSPYILGGSLLMLIVCLVCSHSVNVEWLFLEVTQLSMAAGTDLNIMVASANTPYWFLSSLFIMLPLVTYLVGKYSDVFEHYFMWFLPPVLLLYIAKHSVVSTAWADYYFIYSALMRSFAEILMGCSLYAIVEFLKSRESLLGKSTILVLLYVLATVGLLGVVLYNCYNLIVSTIFLTYIVLMLLALVLSNVFPSVKSGFLLFLGKIALPVFCFHWPILKLLRNMMDFPSIPRIVGIVAAIIIVAGLAIYFDKLLQKKMNNKA
ncbi:MAG: acyltransferase family protein [Paludibacteraceae bacterium]|nr:acyltransferase family protein [Paludibacteraceae bacterium]